MADLSPTAQRLLAVLPGRAPRTLRALSHEAALSTTQAERAARELVAAGEAVAIGHSAGGPILQRPPALAELDRFMRTATHLGLCPSPENLTGDDDDAHQHQQ
jgi:hypothetical protein